MPQRSVAGWLKETDPTDWMRQAFCTSQPLPSSMLRIFSASPMREGFTVAGTFGRSQAFGLEIGFFR
jgi:hypothetical protein